MSDTKFAPMTASLLARKGDAGPSVLAARGPHEWPRPVYRIDPPLRESAGMAMPPVVARNTAPAVPDAHDDKMRRISVPLSHADHERLGIAAVKKNLTRHQIVRDALEHYFSEFSHELHDRCRCMAEGTACQGRCA